MRNYNAIGSQHSYIKVKHKHLKTRKNPESQLLKMKLQGILQKVHERNMKRNKICCKTGAVITSIED